MIARDRGICQTQPARRAAPKLLWVAFPLGIYAAALRVEARSEPVAAGAEPENAQAACRFSPASDHAPTLLLVIVDSLRRDTAWDTELMPWLAAARASGEWGELSPCLSQLSLLCLRTLFEGREPLLAAGLYNLSGAPAPEANLLQQLARSGVPISAVADATLLATYAPWLSRTRAIEERPPRIRSRDEYALRAGAELLAEGQRGLIIVQALDTDAVAHRSGIASAEYARTFGYVDQRLAELAAALPEGGSLVVLGDHGHDAQGRHSTGISAPSAYLARGPARVPGLRRDLALHAAQRLLVAPFCEPEPATALSAAAARSSSGEARAELTATSTALVAFGLGLGAFWSAFLVTEHSWGVAWAASAGLGFSLLTALPHGLWAALAPIAAKALPARSGHRTQRRPAPLDEPGSAFCPGPAVSTALLVASLLLGLGSCEILVGLQAHVNAGAAAGFLLGMLILSASLGWAFRRRCAAWLGGALALHWITFFGLPLGPYYYGAAQHAGLGISALLGVQAAYASRQRALDFRQLAALGLAALLWVPVLLPNLKEWQLSYPLLAFTARLGSLALAGLLAALWGAAAGLVARGLRLGAALAGLGLYGSELLFDLPRPVCVVAFLVTLAYGLHLSAARELERGSELVAPLQAVYAFSLLHVLLGGLRFSGVDFRFALSAAPPGIKESTVAAWIAPAVGWKYLGPIVLLLSFGPRPSLVTLRLLLLKGLCMGAVLLTMLWTADARGALFTLLQAQELCLFVVLYATVLVVYALRQLTWLRARA